jgi:ABC-type lipoprotein release transport system permease subunit
MKYVKSPRPAIPFEKFTQISQSFRLRESATMAVTAIAAHKLRSALTLLGVLVGVFSIIVVMTAMRVMQSNIERN